MNTTSGTAGRHDLIETSLRVAKAAAERRLRHQAKADLVGDEDHGISGDAQKPRQPARLDLGIAPRQHQVRQPQRQAIDQHGAAVGRLPRQRIDQRQRLLDRGPAFAALRAMMRDAGLHLLVVGRRGRQINSRQAAVGDQPLGKGRFAGTRPAQHQRGRKIGHFGARPSSGDQRIGGTRASMPLRSTSARSRHGTRP